MIEWRKRRRGFRESESRKRVAGFRRGEIWRRRGKEEARGEKSPKASSEWAKEKKYDLRDHLGLNTRCMVMTICEMCAGK
jgi:hypothetical protein